ncbi:hypothetical protein LCGC14_1748790 [marine sediment metagenome]|uniref:Uncharacterized protein n=1 Tax=marine sediment metagenome TaxID=412755 RepID=A0A0F9H4K3_9ZZZZ
MTYRQEHYKKNKEKTKETNKIWRENNKERIKKWNKEYHKTHREEYRIRDKKFRHKLKIETINHYGGKCKCCGEDLIEFMTIDHINNNGAEHRLKVLGSKRYAGWKFYLWLRQNNYPKGFQVLCFNCNCAKQFSGICPHKNRQIYIYSNLGYIMKQECSVCRNFTVDTDDPLCKEIKKRHAGRHTKHVTLSERDGKEISQNTIIGEVKWVRVW